MSYVIPLVAMVGLILGWALWQCHRDPYLLLKRTPEWHRQREIIEGMTVEIGTALVPAFRRVAEAAGQAAEAFAALRSTYEQDDE